MWHGYVSSRHAPIAWIQSITDSLDRTVQVPTLDDLTLDQLMAEFKKLAEKNRQLMGRVEPGKARKPTDRSRIRASAR